MCVCENGGGGVCVGAGEYEVMVRRGGMVRW